MNSHKSPTDSKSSLERPRASGNLIVLSGPSGVGKGTVVEGLFEKVPGLKRSVSVTTRACRLGEADGVDYFFLTKEQFDRARQAGDLLEWAEFAGACYGTPRAWVLEQLSAGVDVLLVIEVQGARQIRQLLPHAILVFLSPPSFEALEERLRGRGTESPEKIAIRLKKAQQEMQEKQLFDYEVVNDIVSVAVENLAHIIYAERLRVKKSIDR